MSKRIMSPKIAKLVIEAKQQGHAFGLIIGYGKGYHRGFFNGIMSGLIAACAVAMIGYIFIAYCYIFPLL